MRSDDVERLISELEQWRALAKALHRGSSVVRVAWAPGELERVSEGRVRV